MVKNIALVRNCLYSLVSGTGRIRAAGFPKKKVWVNSLLFLRQVQLACSGLHAGRIKTVNSAVECSMVNRTGRSSTGRTRKL
jgi:hypothetical protein